jgi:hypothetical protein
MTRIALIDVVRTPIPITDSKMRVIAVAAGSPAQDPTWADTHKGAAQVIDESQDKLSFSPKDVFHRRCDDPSKAVRVSFGGGQKVSLHLLQLTLYLLRLQVPGMLLQYAINAAVFASLLSNNNVVRIAGFGSGM